MSRDPMIEYTMYENLFRYMNIIQFVHQEHDVMTKEEFIKTIQFHTHIKIRSNNEDNDVLYVILICDSGVATRATEFKKILNSVKEDDAMIVIVSQQGLGTSVKKYISHHVKKLRIKDLTFNHFKINPRDSVLVPKHTICTHQEKEQVMADNFITDDSQFPVILSTDTQVIWTGGEVGQLMKIERLTTIGTAIYYRIIV